MTPACAKHSTLTPGRPLLEWLTAHRSELITAAIAAVIVFAVTGIAAAIAVVRLPPDFLKQTGQKPHRGGWSIVRNVLGWVMIIAGLAMLALPGPGVVVVILGVALADFPGKQRLLRWLITRGSVLKTMNALRRKFGREPLQLDDKAGQEDGPPSRNAPHHPASPEGLPRAAP